MGKNKGVPSANHYDHQHIAEEPDQDQEYHVNEMSLYQNMFPFDWKRLLETFSKLKHFSYNFMEHGIHYQTHACNLVLKEFMANQINLIGQVRRERPNTLNIDSWNGHLVGGYVIARFCELSLPIRSFTGNFEQVHEVDIRRFVASHDATLKKLTFDVNSAPQFDEEVQILWLPAGLTYLQLIRPLGDCLDFLALVPSLEALIFENEHRSVAEVSFSASFGGQRVVQPLTRMKVFRCRVVLDENAFNIIVNLMHNLRKLTMEIGNERWITASLAWSELQFLEVLQSYWNGSVILEENSFIRYAERYKKLELFVFDQSCFFRGDARHFSDVSIYEGFLKMPRLKSLKIKFSSEVTDEAIAVLKQKIPRVDLI